MGVIRNTMFWWRLQSTMARLHGLMENHPSWVGGLAMGFLPLLSAIFFRTYSYHVTPDWFEQFRQFDALFVMFELWVIFIARDKGIKYAKLAASLSTGERIAACIFFGTFWVSSIFVSQMPAVSAVRVVIWCIHIAFGCAVFHLTGALTLTGMERFAKACFLGLCAYAPILAAHFAFPPDVASLPEQAIIWTSALPGYLSVRLFGFTTATLALLAIGLLWHRNRFALADWWLYIGLALSLTLTFWSGTRGGIYAILLASLTLPFLARTRPRLVWLGGIGATTLIAVLLSEWLYQPDSAFGLFRVENSQSGGNFTSGRYEIWLQSIKLITQRPLLGWGESASIWLLENNPGHQQPHNAILQMLLSWGGIATAAALYIIFRVARILFANVHRDQTLIVPVTVLLGLTVMSSVDGILYNPRTTIIVIFAAASALAIIPQNYRQDRLFVLNHSDETAPA